MRQKSCLLALGFALGCGAVDGFLEGDVPPDARLAVRIDSPSLSLVQGTEGRVALPSSRTGTF